MLEEFQYVEDGNPPTSNRARIYDLVHCQLADIVAGFKALEVKCSRLVLTGGRRIEVRPKKTKWMALRGDVQRLREKASTIQNRFMMSTMLSIR